MGKWKHRLISKDIESKNGVCSSCGPTLLMSNGRGDLSFKCANSYYEIKSRSTDLKQSEKAKNYLAFNNIPKPDSCEICKLNITLHRDHDHITKKPRGWICRSCNLALGYLNDDIDRLTSAIKYLSRE